MALSLTTAYDNSRDELPASYRSIPTMIIEEPPALISLTREDFRLFAADRKS